MIYIYKLIKINYKMQDKGLEWINDNLHDILGVSEKFTVNYVHSMCNLSNNILHIIFYL